MTSNKDGAELPKTLKWFSGYLDELIDKKKRNRVSYKI
jgi:hypothetical protein